MKTCGDCAQFIPARYGIQQGLGYCARQRAVSRLLGWRYVSVSDQRRYPYEDACEHYEEGGK